MEFQSLKPKNIFPYRQISKLTVFISLFIIISATFMRQLMEFVKGYIGETGFIILVGLVLGIPALVFLVFAIGKSKNLIKLIIIILSLIIGLTLSWQIEISQERIHLLEYAVLGWFLGRDLIHKNKRAKGVILACVFSVIVGILDEIFQKILPYRVFDLRDILFNGLGGIWGIILYILS